MSGKIFALRDGEGLTELTQTPYENEDLFQSLIEKYPEILAGEQIKPENPRKWVLISREMSVPLDEGRGSLDHLFIDQDAIPTFIEVKRGTDTRIRREVVGQMLDYAANGIQFWPIDDIRTYYEKSLQSEQSTTLSDIGIPLEKEEDFWQTVSLNLRNGKVRLMFVADEIPISLRSIIEFLNEQMRDTEVFGLEIKQFLSTDGLTTLVPNLVGRTASAVQAKRADSRARYADCNDFLSSVTDPAVNKLYRSLFSFADDNNYKIGIGTAGVSLSIVDLSGKSHCLMFIFGDDAANDKNSIKTSFGWLKTLNKEILDYYVGEIGKLHFFEKTQSANYKWTLSGASTEKDIQMFMSVIKNVAEKIIGAQNT